MSSIECISAQYDKSKIPIIILNDKKINDTKEFVKTYFKYSLFKNYEILLNKLVVSRFSVKEMYMRGHNLKEHSLYAEQTDIKTLDILNDAEINEIYSKIGYDVENFLQKWSICLFQILAEYIKFKIVIDPFLYKCSNCKNPIIFIYEPSKKNKDVKDIFQFLSGENDNVSSEYCQMLSNSELNKSVIFSDIVSNVEGIKKRNEVLTKGVNVLYYVDSINGYFDQKTISNYDSFEKAIEGAMILSYNMDNFNLILDEILANNDNNKYKFELIIDGTENIVSIVDNSQYKTIFNSISIFNTDRNKLNRMKNKLKNSKYITNYFDNENQVIKFLKTTDKNSLIYSLFKLLNFDKYNKKYNFLHKNIAKFYGQTSPVQYKTALAIMNDYLTAYEQDLKINLGYEGDSYQKKKSLLNAFSVFSQIKNKDEDIIKAYTKEFNSYYRDLNNWLNKLDILAYDKIGYFVAALMLSLDMQNRKKKIGIKEKTTLYRGVKMSLAELLQYSINKNKIISFPAFTSSSVLEERASFFSGKSKPLEEKISQKFFSVMINVYHNYNNGWIPLSFNIEQYSEHKEEKERLFQPYSFYTLKEVEIDYSSRTAEISIDTIGRKEILEYGLSVNDQQLIYKQDENIMVLSKKFELPDYSNFLQVLQEAPFPRKNVQLCNNDQLNKNFGMAICLVKVPIKNNILPPGIYRNEDFEKVGMGTFIITPQFKCLLTSNKILNEDDLKFEEKFEVIINGEKHTINMVERAFYTEDSYVSSNSGSIFTNKNVIEPDFTVVEILDTDNINSFMKIKKEKIKYKSNFIAAIQFNSLDDDESELNTTFGYMGEMIDEDEFSHYVSVDYLRSGVPIVDNDSMEIIGIHKQKFFNPLTKKESNMATSTSYILDALENNREIILNRKVEYSKKNEIKLVYIFKKNDIKKSIPIFNKEFYDKNYEKFSLFSVRDKKIIKFNTNFTPLIPGEYTFLLTSQKTSLDLSHFLENIISISIVDFTKFNCQEIISVEAMFNGCKSLKSIIKLNQLNIDKSTSFLNLFNDCNFLKEISDISTWNTSSVTNMSNMFLKCNSLQKISDLSGWDTAKVTSMNNMFSFCSSLQSIQGLNTWKTDKVTDMSFMFNGCSSLKELPDLSRWKTSNVKNMTYMFNMCSRLESLGKISEWDIGKVTNTNYMFYFCNSLESLPDLSKWNTSSVETMNDMFNMCASLQELPDISTWNVKKVISMCFMFGGCRNLLKLPDLDKWKVSEYANTTGMFDYCEKIVKLPKFCPTKK